MELIHTRDRLLKARAACRLRSTSGGGAKYTAAIRTITADIKRRVRQYWANVKQGWLRDIANAWRRRDLRLA
eukprot:6692614-Alexandrium_andersonii.AAC.1